jgi:hypothetical protein
MGSWPSSRARPLEVVYEVDSISLVEFPDAAATCEISHHGSSRSPNSLSRMRDRITNRMPGISTDELFILRELERKVLD